MILLGFIPGPKEPQDIDSFLYPLVQEFKVLSSGIPNVYNAARRNSPDATFLMRAFIVTVGADMIGRSKVNHCHLYSNSSAKNVTAYEDSWESSISVLRVLPCTWNLE
jgi:hypothetical protein